MSVFETLRECVDLTELAGRYTDLRASGDRSRGLCPHPDHADTNPSFYVFPDSRFQCFGCGWRGDVVDLWAGMRAVEPGIEAALDLAREYDVDLPETSPEARRKTQERREREGRYLSQAEARHRALSDHSRVVAWWEGRGFNQDLRERFLLGANREGTAAVIPFWNRGRVQGLIHRRLSGEPKYLYPKVEDFAGGRRPLFVPGPVRAGAHLVEGIVDALAIAALGESAIAVGGTGISREQFEELRKLPGPLYVLPDADGEGAQAAREWVRELYPKALLCPAEYGGDVKRA